MLPSSDINSFKSFLYWSDRVLVVLGAGLSASSGIPTFRGNNGLWHQHDVKKIASPYGFADDPGLVWSFYNERRRDANNAQPNAGHFALAKLALEKPNLLTVTQNIDGLSERAGHPPARLRLIHGSLHITKCSSPSCDYAIRDNSQGRAAGSSLPTCPRCSALLRPGVTWFSEKYSESVLATIDEWIDAGPIQLVLIIGASLSISMVRDYVVAALDSGARMVVVNTAWEDVPEECDWYFEGDAAAVLPQII